jgi:hypothetical protein
VQAEFDKANAIKQVRVIIEMMSALLRKKSFSLGFTR